MGLAGRGEDRGDAEAQVDAAARMDLPTDRRMTDLARSTVPVGRLDREDLAAPVGLAVPNDSAAPMRFVADRARPTMAREGPEAPADAVERGDSAAPPDFPAAQERPVVREVLAAMARMGRKRGAGNADLANSSDG